MRLARLFTLTTITICVLIAALLAQTLYGSWRTLQSSQQGLAAIQIAHSAMILAERLSSERGPANAVLGDIDPPDSERQVRLATARSQSDQSLTDLRTTLAQSSTLNSPAVERALERAATQLATARHEVDQVAALPRTARDGPHIMAAVHEMFDVIPVVMDVVTLLAHSAERNYPELGDALVGARLTVELREEAGRLGSLFTAALAERRALTDEETREIDLLRGRIDELRMLVDLRVHAGESEVRILEAERLMQERYFHDGLNFVGEIIEASRTGRPYGVDPAEFGSRYVADMAAIVELRDAMIGAAVDAAKIRRQAAERSLGLGVITGGAALLILIQMLRNIRARIVRPLLETTRALVNMSRGNLQTRLVPPERGDEIGDITRAVESLRQNSLAKQQLEVERQKLIEELKTTSNTDFLTGLLNRRAFIAAGELQAHNAQRYGWSLALILFDLDHFKNINDQFGHQAGDIVLAQVADIARAGFREGDVVARHGGEEFACLAIQCDIETAHTLAERVRVSIDAASIALADGRVVRISASFGVAAMGDKIKTLENLVRTADRALYRAKEEGRNRVCLAAAS